GLVINARSESIFTKPMFSSSALYRRCLVPAETFFEWDAAKNRVEFQKPDKELMYLAGLWKPSEDETRFVVITAPANSSVSNVHDRMPLIIDADEARAWIFDEDAAKELLKKQLPDLQQIREEEQLSLL
ncbi:MAG: SOS response-associated peptidase family protein, partial [Firmicutes bacterium]|nr:SOS response-associated peptidase family protein [Bacillota bacterium]